jgi:membrane-associated protein
MELITQFFTLITSFIEIVLHLDVHLASMTQSFGAWTYVILFLIIFAETGLVIFPILPGDSLLFAAGAVCALEGSAIQVEILIPLLILAGVIGNTVNYAIGAYAGPKVFRSESSMFLNKNHLIRTQAFYEKHGAMTIIITRFAPLLRTFAPFVAGIGRMPYSKFQIYNIVGAVAWVAGITIAGYIFGNLPVIQRNFHIVILAILIISAMPAMIAWWKARRETSAAKI